MKTPVVEYLAPVFSVRYGGTFLVIAALFLFYSTVLFADEIIMLNGDRITVKVLSRKGDKLKVKTSYAGIIAVEWESIQSVHTDNP